MSDKKKLEFSKILLIQESVLVWIVTLAFIVLAFFCVLNGYIGSLPWLSVIPTCAWGAYGVSQAMYYNKAKAENVIKIDKYYNENRDC
jgi:positive regulator of sigma E activity